MGRHTNPTPRHWPSLGGYYAIVRGVRHCLARGPESPANARAARQRLAEILADANKPRPAVSGITAYDVCERYCAHAIASLAPLTAEFYKRHLGSFMSFRGNRPVSALTPGDVTEWLSHHARKPAAGKARPWNQSTQAGAVTALKRAFRWAAREGLIPSSPFADVERRPVLARELVLTAEQADLIRAALDPRDPFGDLLDFLRGTGCRPSEAYAFEAAHFDRAERVVTFASKTTGATGRKRVIHLTERVTGRVAELAARFPSGPILRALPPSGPGHQNDGRSGATRDADRPPWTRNSVALRFARLRRRLGLGAEATAESYRHLFATDALEAGVPIATVAELMGHRSTHMIERHYSKLRSRRAHLRTALESIRA